jgi:hypothetical protein
MWHGLAGAVQGDAGVILDGAGWLPSTSRGAWVLNVSTRQRPGVVSCAHLVSVMRDAGRHIIGAKLDLELHW